MPGEKTGRNRKLNRRFSVNFVFDYLVTLCTGAILYVKATTNNVRNDTTERFTVARPYLTFSARGRFTDRFTLFPTVRRLLS